MVADSSVYLAGCEATNREFRQISIVGLINLIQRQVLLFHRVCAVFESQTRRGYNAAAFRRKTHAELFRSRLVVGIREAPADAGAINQVTRIDSAEITKVDRIAHFAPIRNDCYEGADLPFHAVEGGRVLILQRKENNGEARKPRENPLARRYGAQNAESQNGSQSCDATANGADGVVVFGKPNRCRNQRSGYQ